MAFLTNIPAQQASDDVLVANYKSGGDLELLSNLYQPYMELVYGVCLKYLKEEEEAKDAVLNIYEELIVKVKKYEIQHFKSWLYQLAKNHCLMKLRSAKKFSKAAVDVSLMQNEDPVHLNGVMEKILSSSIFVWHSSCQIKSKQCLCFTCRENAIMK